MKIKLFFIVWLLPLTTLVAQKVHHTMFFKNEYLSTNAGLFESISNNKQHYDIDTIKWLKVVIENTSTDFNLALLKIDDSTHHYPSVINKLGFDVNLMTDWFYRQEDYDIHLLKPSQKYSFLINLTNLYLQSLITKKCLNSNQYDYTFLYKIYNTDFMRHSEDSIISGSDWFEYTRPPHIQLCNFDCQVVDTTEKYIMRSDEQKIYHNKDRQSFWQKMKSFFSFLFK